MAPALDWRQPQPITNYVELVNKNVVLVNKNVELVKYNVAFGSSVHTNTSITYTLVSTHKSNRHAQ